MSISQILSWCYCDHRDCSNLYLHTLRISLPTIATYFINQELIASSQSWNRSKVSFDGWTHTWMTASKIYIYLFLSGWISVTRLDDFWKLLRGKLSHKSSPNEWRLFGLFWKASLQTIHCFGSFLDNFKVVFISPSGHTDLYVSAQSGKCFSRSLKQCDQIWPNPLGFTEC